MSSFTELLLVEQLPNGFWKIERDLVYFVGEEGSEDKITVSAGFISDFFSIPFPATMFLPKSEKGNAAAVLHDFLFSILGEVKTPYNNIKRTRAQCDKIFLESMKVLGVNWFKRWIMYRAVRMGGGFIWNKHARKLKNNVE